MMCGLAVALAAPAAWARELQVGPGKEFARIEQALGRAGSGDVILVFPLPNDQPYEKTALLVQKKNVTFRGVMGPDAKRVKVSGKGYDYSGDKGTPRAIFQFSSGGDGCTVENFELYEARNRESNGAGVRCNGANDITVRNCEIRDNDNGAMSDGDKSLKTCVNFRFENCVIHHNGSSKNPGQTHNLYLMGTSVALSGCEVFGSTVGHNVKSRAHLTLLEACYIHDSQNREIDLVDADGITSVPDSHAILVGNVIVKNPKGDNGEVIHFGQDGGHERDGTLFLVHNTIVTPLNTAVIDLSSSKAKVAMFNNIIWDGGGAKGGQKLAAANRGGARLDNVSGANNWMSAGYSGALDGTKLDPKAQGFAGRGFVIPFVNPAKGDFHLAKPEGTVLNRGLAWAQLPKLTIGGKSVDLLQPTSQFRPPLGKEARPSDGKPDLGAYEFGKPGAPTSGPAKPTASAPTVR